MSRFDRFAILTEHHLGRLVGPAIHPLVHRGHRRAIDAATRAQIGGRGPKSWWTTEERWFPGGTPPRRHNAFTVLIDGDAYFQRLYKALSEARHYIYIAGWCLTPHVPLSRATCQH
jgi:phosphatidylserine/phosphatidylglycerophosphate/cardiolipin synthase-like enzyme